MTAAYLWRLLCLSLAALFAVQVIGSLILARLARRMTAFAARLEPARAAALLLAARWIPAMAGWLAVALICVPSYLRLEPAPDGPASDGEETGLLCLALAALAVLSYLVPLCHTLTNVARANRHLRRLLASSESAGDPVCIIEESSPSIALAGVFHSRVLVSREVLDLLPPDQIEVAMRHELAHLRSADNLKRLLLELAPLSIGHHAFRTAWIRFTEWAADDSATAGDSTRSMALASALVNVARLNGIPIAYASQLVSNGAELRARVERLLNPARTASIDFDSRIVIAFFAAGLAAAVALALNPMAQTFAHRLLEALMD